MSDVLLWTPSYGRAKAGRPARTYIQQFCEDTGYSPEDLPGAMNDREEWRERVRDIPAGGTTWWWWYGINSSCRTDPIAIKCPWLKIKYFVPVSKRHHCSYCGSVARNKESRGARGVMVIVVGNVHGDTSSNPGPDW